MQNILLAAIFSFTIALPVGAGSVLMLRNGINHGGEHAFLTGLGMNVIDIVMMTLYYFGIANIFSNHYMKMLLYLVGTFVLGKISYGCFKGANASIETLKDEQVQTYWDSILDGIKIALVPSSVIFWVSTFGSFIASSGTFILSCIGILTGFMGCNVAYMFIATGIKKLSNNKVVYYFNIFAGCILACFSLYFLYQFIMELI